MNLLLYIIPIIQNTWTLFAHVGSSTLCICKMFIPEVKQNAETQNDVSIVILFLIFYLFDSRNLQEA